MKLVLATYQEMPNLYDDYHLLRSELDNMGYVTEAVCWDAEIDWTQYHAVIICSTWDYFMRLPEFLAWLTKLEQLGIATYNPIKLMKWNSHKQYLMDLQNHGIPIVPTKWLEPDTNNKTLLELLTESGWHDAILKPAISGGAYLTVKLNTQNAYEHELTLQQIWQTGTAMLQPLIKEVATNGEYSFLFYGGEYQFTVLKQPIAGEFRVQFQYGGITTKVVPSPSQIAQAEKVLSVLEQPTLYARVDMVEVDGRLLLMELELIEPLLFLAYHHGAAKTMAEKIKQTVG